MSRKGKKSKDLGMKLLESRAKKTQFEADVLTIDTSRSEGTITKASDYHLTRDKLRHDIVPSQREGYNGLGCSTLNLA